MTRIIRVPYSEGFLTIRVIRAHSCIGVVFKTRHRQFTETFV